MPKTRYYVLFESLEGKGSTGCGRMRLEGEIEKPFKKN